MTNETTPPTAPKKRSAISWIFDLLLIYVLLAAAFFRVSGIFWGEYQYLHPDERFLVWVASDISPVESIGEYFDTANSSLNPANRGHGFYVYGTLPMFITRYVVEWVSENAGWMEILQVGRSLSALSDMLVVLLVYLIAERLYDKRVGLLAAAFSAGAVLQIQQSHYFTMDTFLNFFMLLAFYFAVRILIGKEWPSPPDSQETVEAQISPESVGITASEPLQRAHPTGQVSTFITHPLFRLSIGFGLALGMAVASKINAAPLAIILPLALGLRLVKMDPEARERFFAPLIGYLALAGFTSLLVFRIFQPYAFSGPGFFDVMPNPQWLSNLSELRAQSSAEVDFPPAMQWARRPVWFSFKNLTLWGLGLPLGALAWAGFLWVAGRLLSGWKRTANWQRHALLWGWTGLYFAWQSMAPNPTMRYQLPIYPMLAIFAAWAVVALYDRGRERQGDAQAGGSRRWVKGLALLTGAVVLLGTYTYAYAFSRIYTRPITRVEASRWIYQNIPGPINLHIQTEDGVFNQPLPFPYGSSILPGQPHSASFQAHASGTLTEVYLPHVKESGDDPQPRSLKLTISENASQPPLASATLTAAFDDARDLRGGYTFVLDRPLSLTKDGVYFLKLSMEGEESELPLQEPVRMLVQSNDGSPTEQSLPAITSVIRHNTPYAVNFTANTGSLLTGFFLPQPEAAGLQPRSVIVTLAIPGEDNLLGNAAWTFEPVARDTLGTGYLLTLDQPVLLSQGQNYYLSLSLPYEAGSVTLSGATLANEGEWDDGLPLRMDGYDPFGGIYPPDYNFNMYWDDNREKLARFTRILDETDYVLISSSRQWGSLPRLPERFPMTTVYYRNLLGCPPEETIEWCYNVAQPGTFQGDLGFKLIETFQSNPSVGPVEINDQFAEEAFTVYDHPKVFVFRKTADYDPQRVQEILGAVDFSKVIHIAPLKAGSNPANLMLPTSRLAEQRQGGTWSQLFDWQAPQNANGFVGVIVWYLSVALLGLFTYPLLRMAFPGLDDKGYPLARIAGLLILASGVWLLGSFQVPFSRLTISAVIAAIALLGAFLAFRQRSELAAELRSRKRYFLIIEGLFIAFFLLDLLLRFANPDLWHPYHGGEKPMDFAYLNAVLKSTTFPPYDPWFAGGYLNYYYFGFVLVGVLIKWLGIVPAIAYNLIIPTIFMLMAMGAFSLAWNLYRAIRGEPQDGDSDSTIRTDQEQIPAENADSELARPSSTTYSAYFPYLTGLAGALGMAVFGNLGIVKMIFQGYQKLAAPGGVIEGAGVMTKLVWAIRGFVMSMAGESLPYSIGDWYWNPSRAIPAPGEVEPITEFPAFTVIYADPHAHLFALPLTLLALSFALALLLGRGRWKTWFGGGAAFLIGALAIGALRPTNTWDFYPYLALGSVAAGYTFLAHYRPSEKRRRRIPLLASLPDSSLRILAAGGAVLLLVALAHLLYQPFAQWYGQGYNQIELWKGTHTPVLAYLTHWGLFLFVILSWMTWESIDWMASTPLSALRKLDPYKGFLQAAGIALLAAIFGLFYLNVRIAWLVLPLAAWAGVLLLRPGQSDAKRFVLFLVGTGLTLTLMVEIIVLRGDIARMNTVFKFYLQVWTLFSISAAAALGWLFGVLPRWRPRWRSIFQFGLLALAASAALFPLMGGLAKAKNRMVESAPHTMDGMRYMAEATYFWDNVEMDLRQDYEAIRWMQENVQGSPVIVEANLRDLYRWGSRFSIYTGLPGVVGWEWHQQQQRALLPGSWVSSRIAEVDDFYHTTDLRLSADFLRKYDVRYIVLGQLERAHYPGPGLEKFDAADGILWKTVYRDGDTVIYEVPPQ